MYRTNYFNNKIVNTQLRWGIVLLVAHWFSGFTLS